MKFWFALTIAFLLTVPGIYAMIAWTVSDMQNNGRDLRQMEPVYRAAFPFFAGTMKWTIIVLGLLVGGAIAIILKMGRGESAIQRSLRITVFVLSLITIAILGFALM